MCEIYRNYRSHADNHVVDHADPVDPFRRNDLDHADPIYPTGSIYAKDLHHIDHTWETCAKDLDFIHPTRTNTC